MFISAFLFLIYKDTFFIVDFEKKVINFIVLNIIFLYLCISGIRCLFMRLTY